MLVTPDFIDVLKFQFDFVMKFLRVDSMLMTTSEELTRLLELDAAFSII